MSAMDWLQDYADCLGGEYGPEAEHVAEKWLEDNPDLPTDGTAWKLWRDFRQTWSPSPFGGASCPAST